MSWSQASQPQSAGDRTLVLGPIDITTLRRSGRRLGKVQTGDSPIMRHGGQDGYSAGPGWNSLANPTLTGRPRGHAASRLGWPRAATLTVHLFVGHAVLYVAHASENASAIKDAR